jgi:predicted Holliday junction resolvase-like endonuclease
METISLLLMIIGAVILIFIGYKFGSAVKDHEWMEKLPKIREDSVKKSRSVLTGNFSEQLAPFMPDFPFSPSECKFLGKPVDLIVFKGLDKGEPEEVIFVEVKTGQSNLSPTEKKLRDTIKQKNVSWYEYRKND